MANNMFFVVVFLLLLMFFSSVTSAEINQDLVAATKEMQKANYFTFVMLIKMSPPEKILEGNVTFLMPNDRMLANMVLQEGSISTFLLRHSVPSPLIFETLQQFPTGTIIPSSLPNCMLRVSNYGRKNFVINNVKIISRNICTAGSSIRCHGIDGVLSEDCVSNNNNSSVQIPICSNSTSPSCVASPPIPSPTLPSPPTRDNLSPTFGAPSPSDANVGTHKSGSHHSYDGSLNLVTNLMLFLLIGIYI